LLVAFELFEQPLHLMLLANIVGKLRTVVHAHPLLRRQYPSVQVHLKLAPQLAQRSIDKHGFLTARK
jgi:hypothetical protein